MAKGFDPELLSKAFLNAAQDVFSRSSKAAPSDPPTTKSQQLIEYKGRMTVSAMDKFNAPGYTSGVSFYLSAQDKEKHKAVGALAFYLEASNAEKFLKALGYSIGDDEEDDELLNACSKLCGVFAEGLQKELKKSNVPDLTMSAPVSEKNSLADGLEFGSCSEKQEISFYFWKKKVLVADVVLSGVPTAR